MNHQFYTAAEAKAESGVDSALFKYVADGGLSVCKVCGCYEGSLPTHCPGAQVPASKQDKIYAGEMDFVDGQWRGKKRGDVLADLLSRILMKGDSVFVRGGPYNGTVRELFGMTADGRAFEVSDSVLGKIVVADVEFHRSMYQPKEGDRVSFQGLAPQSPLKVGRADGVVVNVDSTSGGNIRYRIRTDKLSPQGGGNLEVLVYSQDGRFYPLEEKKDWSYVVDDRHGAVCVTRNDGATILFQGDDAEEIRAALEQVGTTDADLALLFQPYSDDNAFTAPAEEGK